MTGSSSSDRQRRSFYAAGLRYGIEPDYGSSKRPARSLLQHNSLDGASLHKDGGSSQQDKDAMHSFEVQCYDGQRVRSVHP